jgi:hypothetical protein
MASIGAKEAYEEWKLSVKLSLRAYTDEEMFVLGYDFGNDYVQDLIGIISHLEREIERLKKGKGKANANEKTVEL